LTFIVNEANTYLYLSNSKFDFKSKIVLLRIDCDVDLRSEDGKLIADEDFRLKSVVPTINFLQDKGAKRIILLGHLGRPGGKVVSELSLQPVADWFTKNVSFCKLIGLSRSGRMPACRMGRDSPGVTEGTSELFLLENLRFNPGEKLNDQKFAKNLTQLGDVYVNDAFGASHRNNVSIVSLPDLLPSFLGLRFEAEIKTLSWIKKKAKRPLVFILGGSKKGKLDNISFLANWADYLLIGGKLPLLIKNKMTSSKVKIAQLEKSGKDLDGESVKKFKEIIKGAKSIVWVGPLGVYEEEKYKTGTWEVVKAIANTKVFKIAAGGDTHRVLSWLNSWQKFDFVSVGGGAMLQFLKDETLPGIEAVKK